MIHPDTNLAIDAVGAKHSGAAQVALAIVEAAGRSPRVARTIAFVSPPDVSEVPWPVRPSLISVPIPSAESAAGRMWWQARALAGAARRHGATRLLTLSGGGVAPGGLPVTMFIQQSLPFSREACATLSAAGRVRIAVIRQVMLASARRASGVIVQGEAMADLVAPAIPLARGRVRIVRPGLPPDIAAAAGPGETRADSHDARAPRLLYVGNASRYKNHAVISRAMPILASRGLRPEWRATLVPPDVLRSSRVTVLGLLDRARLIEEYRRATCLVMPSLVESFGFPLLESMALSTPIVAADRPYAREVCGDAALYFDPHDPEQLADCVTRLAGDQQLREDLATRGRARAATFAVGDPYLGLIDAALELP